MFSNAFITGASGGIGSALALSLSKRYRRLFLQGRRPEPLQRLAASIPNAEVEILVGDLTKPEFLQQAALAVQANGGLDLLVNNAGTGLFGDFCQQDNQAIEELIGTNLIAPMLLTRMLLPSLRQRQSQVINVGSAFGSIGYPGFSAYCASKFGLKGWTEALSRELSDTSVKVRLFSPRATRTDMNDGRVRRLNAELKVAQDTPEVVAAEFLKFLDSANSRYQLGFPEKFFAWLNSFAPGFVDKAMEKKLEQIRRYF